MNPSFKNRPWTIATTDTPEAVGLVDTLQAAGGLSRLEALVLASRGVAPEALAEFLDPRLKTSLPNPAIFLGMDAAVERLATAILSEERIAIWSDYDVDGACSAAILGRFLRSHGLNDVVVRIPDRIHEGYGPNTPGLKALQDQGITLVCVLDSGTTAFEPLADARAMGLDVVVIDHHMAEPTLPEAVAVVNPNRLDQPAGYGHICAAGMTFLLAVATDTHLRRLGLPGAPLNPLVGLVALATVCDVVPLKTINRAFVASGLPTLSKRPYPGVETLANAAGIEGPIDTRACGFGLGPRINAGGRIGDPNLGARLLMTDCPEEAHQLALELDQLNTTRRDMERQSTEQALKALDGHFVPGTTRALALAVVEAHEGVVGISAARVKEAFDAPSFVLAAAENNTLKGSGRSVAGFDLGSAVVAARQQGLLIKGGGHAMAAGITIAPDKVDAFVAFVNAAIATSEYGRNGMPLDADAAIEPKLLTVQAVQALDRLGPFGMGNPNPRFLIRNVRVFDSRILKDKATGVDKHLKLRIQDACGWGQKFDAPLWSGVGTPLADAFLAAGKHALDIVASVEINTWNGTSSVQLRVEDARLAEVPVTADSQTEEALPF